jgi:hypothetical protein
MPILLIVDKTGTIKPVTVKEYKEDELYKKAGFKSNEGFVLRTTWTRDNNGQLETVSVYGKITGRAGSENKYDFPPPIDKILFFGSCILVAKDQEDECIDLTVKQWAVLYEHLFGGFEDLGSEDTVSDDEEDEDAELPRTKEGYALDGFIVDDKEIEDEDTASSEEEEYTPKKRKAPVVKRSKPTDVVSKTAAKKGKKSVVAFGDEPINAFVEKNSTENTFLDCSSELTEEEYFAEESQ